MAGLFTPEIRTDEAAQARVREWINALRSGKYAQGKSYLRLGDEFCCLGVACDLQKPILGEWYDDGTGGEYTIAGPAFLPKQAQELYRIATEGGDYSDAVSFDYSFTTFDYSFTTSLATLNDAGYTFAEIADIIERELVEALA